MMTEAAKPSSTVSVVASVCMATGPGICQVSTQMAEGAGTRYAGTPNARQTISHKATKKRSAPSGCATSATQRARRAFLGGADAAAAEDELADAVGGLLELMAGLHVEVARPRQPHLDDLGDAARPGRHHHHPVGQHHRLRDRVG